MDDQASDVVVRGELVEVGALGAGQHVGESRLVDPLAPEHFAVRVFLEQLGQRLGLQGEAGGDFRLLILRPEADGVGLALGEYLLVVQLLHRVWWWQLAEVDGDEVRCHALAPICRGMLRL